MPLGTRDIYLLLRARDEASRVVRGFSNELLRSGVAAKAAAARAEAASLKQRAMQEANIAAQAAAAERSVAAQKRVEAANLRATGATQHQIDTVKAQAVAHTNAASDIERAAAQNGATLRTQAKAYEDYARRLETAEKRTKAIATSMQQVGMTLATIGVGLVAAGGLAVAFFVKATQFSKEYQRQVALTQTQTDGFKASLKDLSEMGLQVANTTAIAFEKIQPALFDIFSSTNANLAQGKILLQAFAKASVAGQTDIQKASQGTMTVMNAFRIPLEKVNDVLDVQFQLVRKGVGTYEQFASVYGRIVPSATRAGQTFQTVAAMLAFMTRNGLSAATAATSGARALDAMSNPATVAKLQALGVKVADVKGNFLPLIVILQQLRDHLAKIPGDVAKAKVLQELFKGSGGTIQARRFLDQVLLKPGQLEAFAGFLGDMADASGQFEKAYGTMADTAAAKTQLLSNRWKVLKERIGELITPWMLKLVTIFSNLLDWFNKLDPGVQTFIILFGAAAAVGAILVGLLLVMVGLLAGLVAAFVVAGPEILIVTGVVVGLGLAFGSVIGILGTLIKKSDDFRFSIKRMGDDARALYDQSIKPTWDKIKKAFDEDLKQPLSDLWFTFEHEILPTLETIRKKIADELLPKAKEFGDKIGELAHTTFVELKKVIEEQVIPALKSLERFYFDHQKDIDNLIADIGILVHWLIMLTFWFNNNKVVIELLVAGFIALVFIIITVVGAWILLDKAIRGIVGAFKDLWHWIQEVQVKFRNWVDGIVKDVAGLPGRIGGFFANIGTLLFDAGGRIVQGLIDGMRSKLSSLSSVASVIAGVIASHYPHSPAKRGPLSGAGDPIKLGARISTRLAAGLLSEVDVVSRASNKIADQFNFEPSKINPFAPKAKSIGAFQPAPPSVGVLDTQGRASITINVYTKGETTDPRALAAEIGFQVANRLEV